MWGTPWPLLGLICVFGAFATVHNNHVLDYRGASVTFGKTLAIFSMASLALAFAFVVYWWWLHGFFAALAVVFAVMVGGAISIFVGRGPGLLIASMLGLLAIPICALLIVHVAFGWI